MRYEVHLVQAPAESHAALMRMARAEATVSERDLAAAMRPGAVPQVVARYGAVRSAERLQMRLSEAGCAAVVVDRGSALSRWLESRFGQEETAGATTTAPTAPPVDPASGAAGSVPSSPAESTILRQDAELRRRAEAAESTERLKRRLLGAVLGLVVFAILAGLLALASSLIRSEPATETRDSAERGGAAHQSSAAQLPPVPAAEGNGEDEQTDPAEAPGARADQRPPAALAAVAGGETDRADEVAPPAEPAPTTPALRESPEHPGTAGRIVGIALAFVLSLGLGFGLLSLVRWMTASLPPPIGRALRLFAGGAFVFISTAAALVQVQVQREAPSAPAPVGTSQVSDAAEASGAAMGRGAATGPRVSAFVAQLGAVEPEQRFGPMADRLLAPPDQGSGEGSGEGSGAGEGGGLRPAGEWIPDAADREPPAPDVSSFVASLPPSEPGSACITRGGRFEQMACAIEQQPESQPGDRVTIVVRETPETDAGVEADAAAPDEPDEAAAPATAGSGAQTVAAAASPPPSGARSPGAEPPGEALPEPGATEGDDDGTQDRPEAPPARSVYATPALAGFGSGTVLELALVPWLRRRRRTT